MNGPFPKTVIHYGFPCHGCRVVTDLCKLNDDMLCVSCGEPEQDPSDMTVRERFGYGRPFNALREWGTW